MSAAIAFARWFPWVLLAIAVTALSGLIVRFALMYRNMKRERLERLQASREEAPVLGVDGDRFVMYALRPYGVGETKQLRSGVYLLGSEDGGTISLQINGIVVDYSDGETITLGEGDTVRSEKDIYIKPYTEEK